MTATPLECPNCKADLSAGDIPDRYREYYSPPYKFSRVVGEYSRGSDRIEAWRCPDCNHRWGP
jgi:hypothetical protein